MRVTVGWAVVTAALFGFAGLGTAEAAGKKAPVVQEAVPGGGHPASGYYRKGPQVRGYVQRKGGYSYTPGDVTNTYGQSRTIFGGANTYRAPGLDRQTTSGPFDHGFFWDSGIAPRGGNSPYLN
jgi:hypothetical protein